MVVVVSLGMIWNDELAQLLDPGCTFLAVSADDTPERDEALAAAEVVVTSRFTASMANACKRLRLIVCPPAGTEGIDRTAIPAGVVLRNGVGHEIAIAEYVIGCCVALRQHLLEGDHALRQGRWRYGFQSGNGMLEELWGSKLGLVGFGSIGREVAARARAFGMTCAAVTLHPQRSRDGSDALAFMGALFAPDDVDRLVAWADQIVVCCELSEVTLGLIDARRLGLAKPTAILVNVARGPIVVERDLFSALKQRRIAGAALDVWYRYPDAPGQTCLPAELPFWELENVILTPHASGWTRPTKRRRLEAMAKTINEFAAGR
jgi:phosphoglycerate dehydrogenase-like enzyme